MIRRFKLFLNPVEGQAKWLNGMASRGYRLSHVGNIFYYFEPVEAGKYQYAVDYVANKSLEHLQDYESFLEESKIRWIEKPGSIGKLSWGNVRYRPYADRGAQLATSGGMIKREFLILERENRSEPFEIYTTVGDQIQALKVRRKPYIYLAIFLSIMFLLQAFKLESMLNWSLWSYRPGNGTFSIILLGGLWVSVLISLVRFQLAIRKLKSQKEI